MAAAALLVGTCLGGGAAQALDAIWTGLGLDGQWTTAANWDTVVLVPDGTATFTLTAFPTSITIMSGATTSIGEIQFIASPDYDYTITGNTNFAFNAGGISSVQASFVTNGGSSFDISGISVAGATVGSIAGAGNYALGAKQLTTGGNNASTEVSGVISGTGGSLVKQGTGTLILSGTNTYSGGTTVSAGTLQLGNASATGSIVGDVTNNGTLIFNRSNAYTFAGVISGSGAVAQDGAGATTLTATHAYTGATTVNAGTLLVNGSIDNSSLVTVNGGTLGGTGTVATTIVNAGTLAPGNSIGTMVVSGDLTFNNGSTYSVELSPTAADRTQVTNVVTINAGSAVVLTPEVGRYQPRTYTVLNSILGTVTGTFASTTVVPPTFFSTNSPWVTNPHLTYDAQNVYLVLDAAPLTPFLPATASQNQRNVAGGIDRAYLAGATLPTAFQDLYFLPPATLAAAMTMLSGEVRAHTSQAGIRLMSPFLSMMLDPFVDNRLGALGGGFGPATGFAAERRLSPEAAAAYAAVNPKGKDALAQASAFDRRWGTWASAFGGHNKINGDATLVGSGDMSMRANGVASGLDYRMSPDTVVGFALAGGNTSWMLADGMSGGRSEALQAGLYASHRNDGAYVSSALAYAWHRMSTDRLVVMGGVNRLGAEFSGHSLGGRIESGRRFAAGNVGFTPYAALQIQAFSVPAYTEIATQGSSTFALSYDRRMTMAMRTELGAGFDKVNTYRMGQVTIRGRLAWAHDRNSEPSVTAAFQALPGSSFTVNGAKPPSDLVLASMGMEIRTPRGISLGAKIDGEFGRGSETITGTGSLRYTW